MRKAMGPDEVAGWILKGYAEQLVTPIYDIIDKSLKQGELPIEWKRANIVPIFKSGNKEDTLNYRPVSLTSVTCKLYEKVMKSWIYFQENKVLTDVQFGFREGISCVTNLMSL